MVIQPLEDELKNARSLKYSKSFGNFLREGKIIKGFKIFVPEALKHANVVKW